MINNKIAMYFSETEYNNAVQQLKNNINDLQHGVELCKTITDGKITDFDLNAVNEYLKKKLDMPNLEAVADMLTHKENYIKLKELDARKVALQSEYIVFDSGNYKLTEDALEVIKTSLTTYLGEDKLATYSTLKKAVDLLNTLSPEDVASMSKAYDGKFQINLQRLNTNFRW